MSFIVRWISSIRVLWRRIVARSSRCTTHPHTLAHRMERAMADPMIGVSDLMSKVESALVTRGSRDLDSWLEVAKSANVTWKSAAKAGHVLS